MTRLLYLDGPDQQYEREFSAQVTKRGDDYVVLDRTLFYPTGGGQEHDTGTLTWEGGRASVVNVEKKGIVKHYVDPMPPENITHVHGTLDWERRYALMRMHTAQHLLSGWMYDHRGEARTVGNQLHPDRARIDFRPLKVGHEDLLGIEASVNQVLKLNLPVRIENQARHQLEARMKPERSNLDLIPKAISELRVIEIGDVDACPCGGTHVRNTQEIGTLRFVDRSNKGSETTRVEYVLDGGP